MANTWQIISCDGGDNDPQEFWPLEAIEARGISDEDLALKIAWMLNGFTHGMGHMSKYNSWSHYRVEPETYVIPANKKSPKFHG